MHGALVAMIRFVADRDVLQRPRNVIAIGWPRLRHCLYQPDRAASSVRWRWLSANLL